MIVKIDDAFSMIRNGANIKQGSDDSGYPITRIETIANRVVDRNRMGYAGIKTIAELQDYVLQDGDILMSHINSERHLGKVAIYEKQENEIVIHGMNLLCLRPKTEILNSRYAFYYLSSEMFLRQIPNITKKSVNQASFNITSLKELMIPIVSMELQLNIVDILDKLQTLIDKLNYQLIELDKLVKSRFLELFGVYPANEKGWLTGTIRDVISEVRYGSSRPAVDGGQYPYLRMNNITYGGELDLSDTKRIDIPDNELVKCTVRRGDVLFNRTNSKELVGKTCVYNRDEMMVLAGFVIRVRVNEKALPEFLSAFLNTDFSKKMLLGMCKSAIGQANINAQELQNIGLYIPPIDLQQEFVDFKIQVDKSKLAVQQGLQELETLKKSLMQQYFG